jgi:mannobiose 2-epimerase
MICAHTGGVAGTLASRSRRRAGSHCGMALAAAVLWAGAAARPAPGASAEPQVPPSPTRDDYLRLAGELESQFREVLRLWFPRCVDRVTGGFLEHFAVDWTHKPESGKFLVFQARMTWVAAEASAWAPELREEFLGYTRHGVKFLNEAMRDKEHGGVHYRLGPDGKPDPGLSAEKHAYGLSFAMYAAAAAYEKTKDAEALALAKDTFAWLEAHAHDARNGGYFESLTREGKPQLASAERRMDGIGTLVGFKSMNSHIHLLEALTTLYRVWPDPGLRARLEEIFAIVRDKIAVEPGCLNLFFTPDWRPVPAHDSFGHDIETAYLLVEAAEVLGKPEDAATWRVARSLVDHALDWGFDDDGGGFFEKGEAFAPAHDTSKVWWTQAEGLNALLLMHERFGKEIGRYFEAARKQWKFIRDFQIDGKHGEWFGSVTREGKPSGDQDKASPWKAAYHNGRALMNGSRILRRLAQHGDR